MPDIPYRLRPLALNDLQALMAIENEVFPLPWPASVYRTELMRGDSGVYLALDFLFSPKNEEDGQTSELVGYGGFWPMGDEAHVMTIAIALRWQGQGLGEWLLLAMLDAMVEQGAQVATLEVRASNQKAQSLYKRLGFEIVGRRRRYYQDTDEDALIMTSSQLSSPDMLALRKRRRKNVFASLSSLRTPYPPRDPGRF